MEKTIYAIMLAMILLMSCRKEEDFADRAIRFSAGSLSEKDGMVETDDIGDFLLSAYPADSPEAFCLNRTTVRSGNTSELPGYYWPLEGSLDFYASFPPAENQNIAYDESYGEVCTEYSHLDGTRDYVGASATGVSRQGVVNLEFHHLLSNFSQLQLTASHPDASLSIASVRIRLPESAVYGYESDTWLRRGGYADCVFTSPDGLFNHSLVPGTYTLTVEYEICMYGASSRFRKSADITFRQGYRTRVSGIVENDMSLSVLNVSSAPWSEGNVYSYTMQDVTPTYDLGLSDWTDVDWGEVSFLKQILVTDADGAAFTEFRASCYAGGSQTANYMYDEKFSSDGGEHYVSEHEFPCLPQGAGLKYYAYSPCDSDNIRLSPRNMCGVPYVDYTVPEDIALQKDLLTGCTDRDEIHFSHALSRISLCVDKHSELEGTVFHLSVNGAASAGRIPLDGSAVQTSSPGCFYVSSPLRILVPGELQPLLGKDEFFYMLPQTLGADSFIRVGIRVDGMDCYYECNIGGDVWKAGQTVSYVLNFTNKTLNYRKL